MVDTSTTPPKLFTLDELGSRTFTQLYACYQQLYPDKGAKEFSDELWNPMLKSTDTFSGEEVLEQMYASQEAAPSEPIAAIAPLIVATAFCSQSRREHLAGNRDAAWTAMAEARYWCGVAIAGQGGKSIVKQAILATKRHTAAKGGSSRAEKYQPIKNEAYRLAREMAPPTNGWQSRSQAAKEILSNVLKFSVEQKMGLSQDQALKTIDKWLSEMPDASTLFPNKKRGT